MNRIIAVIVNFLFFNVSAQEYQPRNITSIEIQNFKRDSTRIRAIQAVDGACVFYAGSRGNLGFTTNTGNTWTSIPIQFPDSILPNFRSLGFNGTDYFAITIENPALLYKISKGIATLKYQEMHEKVFYDTLTFFEDAVHGIAVGDPTADCASILTTEDRGETWHKIPCAKLPKILKGEAFFAASNTNIKTIGSTVWIASGGTAARILKSTDYGLTWEIYDTPIIQGIGPQEIYPIDFYDDKNGIIIGGDYSKPMGNVANKASTTDGGKTWTILANGKHPNYKSCVQYVPNTAGKEVFAVGKTGISYSKDGGNSWVEVSKERYYTIQFTDKNTAWLGGDGKIGKFKL
jgi:photosystem II stability/assembly factor-like uncharacterized protein